jgi:hypothetical protein
VRRDARLLQAVLNKIGVEAVVRGVKAFHRTSALDEIG